MHKTYLTPGPSELYFTVDFHVKQALKARIPSISHRSKTFEGIFEGVKNNLSKLLNLPDDYQVYIVSSATEIWERMAQNLIEKESFHLTNGTFAEKFIKVVEAQNKTAITYRVSDGKPFLIDSISIPDSTELISITQNETSTGTRFPVEDINKIRNSFPDPLIAIDAVSSLPYENFDFSKIDSLYFSVQKCFGLPSGLGVWLVNRRCLEKANELEKEGKIQDSYHSLASLHKYSLNNQTPETPNVLDIYLFSKVLEDMLEKGIGQIRREIDYKAALMYNCFDNHENFKPFVEEPTIRSKTIIMFETDKPEVVLEKLKAKGFVAGSGYGKYKNDYIRIANFPTHSKEKFEILVDTFDSIKLPLSQ